MLALAASDTSRRHRLRAARSTGGQHRAAAEHLWLGQNIARADSIVVLLGVHDMPDPGWIASCQVWCATGPRLGGVALFSLLAAVGVGVTNISLGFVWSQGGTGLLSSADFHRVLHPLEPLGATGGALDPVLQYPSGRVYRFDASWGRCWMAV